MIAIIDYGMGNTGSIKNMLKKVGYDDVVITNKKEEISASEKIILPGVGAFDNAMTQIEELSLKGVLEKEVFENKKALLGICLGMQLLTKGSEEGKKPGLGWIDAYTYRFRPAEKSLKVPHMGWQEVSVSKPHEITSDMPEAARYYFVHSYYVALNNKSDELMSCNYGIDFTCALQHENIIGVQFHPEKSHKYGMHIFSNFLKINSGL